MNFTRFLARTFLCKSRVQNHKLFVSTVKTSTTSSLIATSDVQHRFLYTSSICVQSEEEKVTLIFKNCKGDVFEIKANVGQTIYDAAKENDIELEGACGGQRACSTCHVYVDESCESQFEEPTVEEEDLIDKAAFPQANSRLACQLRVVKDLEGAAFTLPKGTINFYVDGHKPEHH